MPVITLKRDRFSEFIERDITLKDMIAWLPWLGFDLEDIGEDYVKVEFNPNRIDYSSYIGVARAFKGLKGWETGLQEYETKNSGIVLCINEAVSEVRPFMLAAVVRHLSLDEEDIVDLMEMQEDIHWGEGKDFAYRLEPVRKHIYRYKQVGED